MPAKGPTTAKDVPGQRFPGDPRPAADGACLMCTEQRPPVARKHEDPFHARPCCEAFYAGELPREVRLARWTNL